VINHKEYVLLTKSINKRT